MDPDPEGRGRGNAGLYDYLQNVQGFLAPPITAVFLLGLGSERIPPSGAFYGYFFAGVLFAISVALMVGISAVTRPRDEREIRGLTFGSLTPEEKAENRASWGAPDIVGTVVVLGLVVGIYLYFSFWV